MSKQIYVVFTATNTKMGKFIRFITKSKYNHVSISFDKKINKMYSFARYYKNAPLVGGFVTESALRYTLTNHQALTKICEIPLSEEKYNEIFNYVESIKNSKDYMYNTLSATLVPIQKSFSIYKSFTCIEFVNKVLSSGGILLKKVYTINDLEKILAKNIIFEGNMIEVSDTYEWGEDEYYKKKNIFVVLGKTIKHFTSLFYRLIMH